MRRLAPALPASSSTTPFNVLMVGAGPVNFGAARYRGDHLMRRNTRRTMEPLPPPRTQARAASQRPRHRRPLHLPHRVCPPAQTLRPDSGTFIQPHPALRVDRRSAFEARPGPSVSSGGACGGSMLRCRLAIIGTQARWRGSTRPGSDMEFQLMDAWPDIGAVCGEADCGWRC